MRKQLFISIFLILGLNGFGQTESIKSKLSVLYHDNGKTKANGHLLNSEKNGQWNYWDYNENLIKSENYTFGKLDGEYLEYYSNGNIKIKGSYILDKETVSIKNGYWFYYNEQGNLTKQFFYMDGIEYENKLK